MKIGLDHDGCLTEDIEAFLKIIQVFHDAGHEVYLVTMRYPSEIDGSNEPIDPRVKAAVKGIVCTCRQAKKPFCLKMGLKVDVWIDDNPEAITKSAVEIWGWCTPEGEVYVANHSNGDSLEAPRPTGGFVDCPDGPVLGPDLKIDWAAKVD